MHEAMLDEMMPSLIPSLEEELETLAEREKDASASEPVRGEELQREIRAALAKLERLLGEGN